MNPYFHSLPQAILFGIGAVAMACAQTGFRNDGSGIFGDAKPPLHWSATSNVTWSVALKSSNASPLPLGDKILVCEEPDRLLALRFADGGIVWSATNSYAETLTPEEAVAAREKQKKGDALGASLREADRKLRECEKAAKEKPDDADAKTQAAEARKHVGELRKELEALNLRKLPSTHEVNGYTSPTPVTDGKNIYVLFCSGVTAAYTPDGRRLWIRILPGQPHNGWGHCASPRLAGGALLVHYGNKLFALDPEHGTDKWTADAPSGFGSPIVATVNDTPSVITPQGDFLALAGGARLASGVFKFPWNGPIVADGTLYKMDENGASAFPLKYEAGSKPVALWNAKIANGRYYATSVLHEGILYNVNAGGTLVALHAKDGSLAFEKVLDLGKGTYYPSPAIAGGYLYVSCDNGTTAVLKPGRVYEEIARNKLAGFRSSPVFVGGSLLVRTTGGLVRIDEK